MTAKKYFKDINAISSLEIIIILFNISSHMEKDSIDLKQGSWFTKIVNQAWQLKKSQETSQNQVTSKQKQKLYQQCFLNSSPANIPKLKKYLEKEFELSSDAVDSFVINFIKFLKKKQANCRYELKELQNQINQIKQEGGQKTLQYLIRIKFAQSYQKRYSSLFKLNLSKQFQIPNLQQIIKKAKKYNIKFLLKTLEKLNTVDDHYETWKEALSKIETLNVQKIMNLFGQYNEKDNDFSEDQKIIYIIGPSGVGKTTFITVMGGYQLQPVTQQGQTYYVAKNLLIRQKYRTSNLDSQTIIPGVMKSQIIKDVVLIDCEGFFDRRSQQIDILNNLINEKLVNSIKHMRIVIMMAEKMVGLRGQGLHTFAQAISKYFQSYQQVKNNITIVFNIFDKKTFKKIKDFVTLIAQKIDNDQGKFNQNYRQFIFHLEEILKQQQNYVKFDPSNCSQRTILNKILKSEQLQDPKSIIKVSFSQQSKRKIKQQAEYYSKMIQETYNNRQFQQFRFYLTKLKTLQDKIAKKIDDWANYFQKITNFINQKNKSIVESFSKQLSLFFQSNKDEYLNNVIQMRKNIIEASQFEIQSIKSPKQEIFQLQHLKSNKIFQHYTNLKKDSNLINAQLRFMKLINEQKFNQIKQISAIQFQLFYSKFLQISVINEQNLNKINNLQNNSAQICKWIKDQFIQKHVQSLHYIIEDAKQIKIDVQQIENFFFKLQLMKGMSPAIQNMLEKQQAKYERKINNLLFEYVQILKKSQCNVQKLKKFRIYKNNYQELMKIQAIKQKNSIFKLKFTDIIQTFINIQSQNIQSQKEKIIQLLNNAYMKNILIQHQPVKKIIKKIIKLMNFMVALQNDDSEQFNSESIKESIKQSNLYVIDLIQAIRTQIAYQKVENFKFNLYLLNLFIVASQLTQIRYIQNQKDTPFQKSNNIIKVYVYQERVHDMIKDVIYKINEPLAQMTTQIQEKNELNNKIQQKVQKQEVQTQKDEKQMTKKNSRIKKQWQHQLITEINFQNLKNLFIYFQQLEEIKKLIAQSDSINCRIQKFKNQNSPQFIKCIQILFQKIKLRFYQLSQCYKHEQFDSERKETNSAIRQLEYSQQKKSIIYLKSYELIKEICNKFKRIRIINDFRKDSLQLCNLKDYIESRIGQIINQYKAGKYQGNYIQINQILNQFGNIIRIYSRAYKIPEEDKKQYDQTVLKIRQSKQKISKNFSVNIESIEKKIIIQSQKQFFDQQKIQLQKIQKIQQDKSSNKIQQIIKKFEQQIVKNNMDLENNIKKLQQDLKITQKQYKDSENTLQNVIKLNKIKFQQYQNKIRKLQEKYQNCERQKKFLEKKNNQEVLKNTACRQLIQNLLKQKQDLQFRLNQMQIAQNQEYIHSNRVKKTNYQIIKYEKILSIDENQDQCQEYVNQSITNQKNSHFNQSQTKYSSIKNNDRNRFRNDSSYKEEKIMQGENSLNDSNLSTISQDIYDINLEIKQRCTLKNTKREV